MIKKIATFVIILFMAGCATSHNVVIPNFSKELLSSNAIVVFDSSFVNVKKTGAYIKTSHVLVKILSMKGKAEYTTPSFNYTTKYGRVRVKSAYVIKKDGRLIKVKKDNIKDVKVPAFGKFFLPNVRMVKIVFPNVEKGDAIEYTVEEDIKNPPMEGEFDDLVLFESTEPVLSKYYAVKLPMRLYFKVYNDKDKEVKFENKNGMYIWSVSNEKPLIREPMMPPLLDVGKKLLVSTVKSWKKWSVWYWSITENKLSLNDTMIRVIDSLLKDVRTHDDTLKKLFYYVSGNIRYVATTMNGKKAGYEPFPATKTFRQKYGVCRDKAALLVAMYRYVGIDAYPVLTNPMVKVEKEIAADQFNHAIVAVKAKKDYIYIDPTAEDIPVLLPFYEQGKGALVCTPQGEDFAYTPVLPADSNNSVSTQELYLYPNGDMKGISVFKGVIIDQQFRMMVKKIPPDRLKRIFSMSLSSLGEESSLDTLYYSDPDDFKTPFTLTIKFTVKGFATVGGNNYVFSTQGGSTGNMFGASPFSLDKRKYPVYMFIPSSNKSNIIIHLPSGYTIKSIPSSFHGENKYVKFDLQVNKGAKSIVVNHIICFKKSLIPPEYYKDTKKIYDAWQKNLKKRFILLREDKK